VAVNVFFMLIIRYKFSVNELSATCFEYREPSLRHIYIWKLIITHLKIPFVRERSFNNIYVTYFS